VSNRTSSRRKEKAKSGVLPFDQANFHSRVWRKLLAKAGLRYIRVHDLRHTFASLLIQNGESLAYVKEQMGRHSIIITVDTWRS
jgi:integrase